jgi:hypothetical protein
MMTYIPLNLLSLPQKYLSFNMDDRRRFDAGTRLWCRTLCLKNGFAGREAKLCGDAYGASTMRSRGCLGRDNKET